MMSKAKIISGRTMVAWFLMQKSSARSSGSGATGTPGNDDVVSLFFLSIGFERKSILAKTNTICYFMQETNKPMASVRSYIRDLAAKGQYHFTTQECRAELDGSLVAVRAALGRLIRRVEIASPHRGFHVIVPPEYRILGCLPPEQFIPQLMNYLQEPYYVTLLSAAELHSAAHQRPQRFQVMTAKNRRPIACGQVRVEFVARHDLEKTPVVEMKTPRGRMRVSSPEATLLEVVGYAKQCGGLDNVLVLLTELAECSDPVKLLDAARLCPVAWSQRLGYLLEVTGQLDRASKLASHVQEHAKAVAPLVRARPITGAPRAERWKLAINTNLELDW